MSLSEKVYQAVIQVYPQTYLDEYEEQMLITFRDLAREHKSQLRLWQIIIFDLIKSLTIQYMQISYNLTNSKNRLAFLTLIFLLPFFVFIGCMIIFQIFNLSEAANAANNFVDHHSIWLTVFVGILPFAAILVNLFALVYYAFKDQTYQKSTTVFVKDNFFNVSVLALAMLVVVFIAGHDALPCAAQQLWSGGWRAPFHTLSWCMRNS